MAWSYLSRIFSFSRHDSHDLGPSSKTSDAESSSPSIIGPSIEALPTERSDTDSSSASLPPTTGTSTEHALPRQSDLEVEVSDIVVVALLNESSESNIDQSDSEIRNDIVEALNKISLEPNLAQSHTEIRNDIVKALNDSPESNLGQSDSEILNNIVEALNDSPPEPDPDQPHPEIPNVGALNEPPESSPAEALPDSRPSSPNSSIEAALLTPSDAVLSSGSLPLNTIYESPGPGLNISHVSLLIRSADECGNQTAFTQLKAFAKKAARTVRRKRTPAQMYILENWDSRSSRLRSSSTVFLSSTTRLPSPLAQSSSSPLPLSSPKIFVDASADGIGFIFNDRWLAWTFTPNHPDIPLGSNNSIIMSWAELIAVELGILTLIAIGYRDVKVLVRSDNLGVVNALKRRKWKSKYGLDVALERILHLCAEATLVLDPGWIWTKRNPADGASRGEYPPLDLMLYHRPPIPPHLQGLIVQVEAA